MNIDAKNLVLGRVCAYAAKQALLGENVNVVNCELAVISGKRNMILNRYRRKVERGDPHHGPFFPRNVRDLVRRTIRGMLPWRQARGREAYKRVKCFLRVPEKYKELETIENANVKRIKNTSYITVKELSESLK